MSTKWMFVITALLGMICAVCIFGVNSAFADKYRINGLYIAGAILFGLAAIYTLIKVIKRG